MSGNIHVVWKRPDGFHGATPADYKVVEVNGHSRLWLHRKDREMYPFRISGGWEEDIASRRLNRFINLINQGDREWLEELSRDFDRSHKNDGKKYLHDLDHWFLEISTNLKGDKWEVEIMEQAVNFIRKRAADLRLAFDAENPA